MHLMFVLGILTMIGCQSGEDEKYKPPLSEQQMITALSEMQLIEARAVIMRIDIDTIAPVVDSAHSLLLDSLGLDEQAFMETYAYYENNPNKMDALFQLVIDNLTRREAALHAEKERSDSIAAPIKREAGETIDATEKGK